jgi:hypothetical protein
MNEGPGTGFLRRGNTKPPRRIKESDYFFLFGPSSSFTPAPEQSMATALSTQRRLLIGRWTKQIPTLHDYFSTNSPQKKKKQQELVIPVELVSDTL